MSGKELNESQRLLFERVVVDLKISDRKLEGIFKKYEFEKIEQAHLGTVNRMKVQHIDNPSGYFVSLLSNAEFGLSERQEKLKRKQLQMKIVENDKTEHKELERETEVKKQVTAWILEHPDKFEEMVDEEGHRLG